jgi:hypothetical protein
MQVPPTFRGVLAVLALALLLPAAGLAAPRHIAVAPTISKFSPSSGPIGTVVTIQGANFTPSPTVTFNKIPGQSVTANEAGTQISASVPPGGATGLIAVTTGGGTATSAGVFTVTATTKGVVGTVKPVVSSLAPASGKVGSMVTITGKNFTVVKSVAFGGTKAKFYKVVSTTKLSARVPAKAKTGKVAVTTQVGTGTSASRFTVK